MKMITKALSFDEFFEEATKKIPNEYEPIKDIEIDREDIDSLGGELLQEQWDNQRIIPLAEVEPEINPWGDLNDDDRRLIDGGVRQNGFEIIAFYKSKRFENAPPFRGSWGIYYLKQGLRRVQEHIESDTSFKAPDSALKALDFVRAHERFHYKFDLWALTVESATRRNLYKPLKDAFRHFPSLQVEEALANRDAYNWAKSRKNDLSTFAKNFINCQHGAYLRYNEPKVDLLAELGSNLIDQKIGGSRGRYDQTLWYGKLGHFEPKENLRPPEYLIVHAKMSALIPSYWSLPKISEIIV